MANSYDDYQKQLASIYEQIQNRGQFQYDMNADPLYQQYKDQYVQGGKLAMKDTMGQAAGLTGGYGSTYGQQVGQQAYNSYLQNLGAQIPKLYEMAYGMYRDRGDDLLKQYNFLKANPVEAPLPEVLPAGGGSGGGGSGGGGGGDDPQNPGKSSDTSLAKEIEDARKAGANEREIISALIEKANQTGVTPLSVLEKAGYAPYDWSKYQPKKKPSYGAGGGKPNLMATK
jgi:hypothetical protein